MSCYLSLYNGLYLLIQFFRIMDLWTFMFLSDRTSWVDFLLSVRIMSDIFL